MAKNIGFIGAGNMATAIYRGFLQKNILTAEQVTLYDIHQATLETHRKQYGVHIADSPQELIDACDIVVLAVKPHVVRAILPNLFITDDTCLVSIAAGVSYSNMQKLLPGGKKVKMLRIMPSTPHMAGEGVAVFATPYTCKEQDAAELAEMFRTIGAVEFIEERLMSAVTGLSGSGPAFVYLFIEALADAGVRNGLPRDTAQTLAAQTVLGGAKMVLESGEHPGQLKDNVCSPGGTTIEGVAQLEACGFRNAAIQAVTAAAKRAEEL